MEEYHLVSDLALILISAALFTIVSKALKQPLILGYIVAGFIVGPHSTLFPTVTSPQMVEQWSEIGIIFLLFTLGLEFSFKRLIRVGSSALIMAVTKCIGMFLLGIVVGRIMSWTLMESVFLGGLLSMSSTTIIIKTYNDMGLKSAPYASLVFGSLVFEDLIAILMLVLLGTMAVSNSFAGGEMLMGMAKLLFFLVLWFAVGIYLIPTILKLVRSYLNDEILLLISLGLCFGMVTIAEYVGFSAALGAFVMGSILAETLEGEHIVHITEGIKDMFGAIFFVSVGMMINPVVIVEHWGTILILTVVAVVGILIFSTLGSIISGQSLENSLHAAFSLAQLGEFAFIIAGLGCSLGVMRDFIYPVVIAVAVITTFATPYMIRLASPTNRYLNRYMPTSVLDRINSLSPVGKRDSIAEKNEWRRLIRMWIIRVVMYGVILTALFMGAHLYLDRVITLLAANWVGNSRNIFKALLTILVMTPFLGGLAITGDEIGRSLRRLVREKKSNVWPALSLMLIRVLLAMAFVIAVIVDNFSVSWWILGLVLLSGVIFFLLGRRTVRKFALFENRFIANLNVRENHERDRLPVSTKLNDKLAGYNVKTKLLQISPDSNYIGRRLKELSVRDKTGVNIVKIIRGSSSIIIPSGDMILYPYDRVLVVGTESQLALFAEALASSVVTIDSSVKSKFTLESILLTPDSFLTEKRLRDTDMRSYGCMVISVIRNGVVTTNPKADFRFQTGDLVWLAGEKSACEWWQ